MPGPYRPDQLGEFLRLLARTDEQRRAHEQELIDLPDQEAESLEPMTQLYRLQLLYERCTTLAAKEDAARRWEAKISKADHHTVILHSLSHDAQETLKRYYRKNGPWGFFWRWYYPPA